MLAEHGIRDDMAGGGVDEGSGGREVVGEGKSIGSCRERGGWWWEGNSTTEGVVGAGFRAVTRFWVRLRHVG